jgi:hypothetical protein
LPPSFKTQHPGVAWQNMAAAGNIYRHEYEDVAAVRRWVPWPKRSSLSANASNSKPSDGVIHALKPRRAHSQQIATEPS